MSIDELAPTQSNHASFFGLWTLRVPCTTYYFHTRDLLACVCACTMRAYARTRAPRTLVAKTRVPHHSVLVRGWWWYGIEWLVTSPRVQNIAWSVKSVCEGQCAPLGEGYARVDVGCVSGKYFEVAAMKWRLACRLCGELQCPNILYVISPHSNEVFISYIEHDVMCVPDTSIIPCVYTRSYANLASGSAQNCICP